MPNHKDIFHNKMDFAHAEFATEMYKPAGRPQPRETKSQEAQLKGAHQHGESKNNKRNISDKL